jgi:hypothetical protein
MVNAHWPTPTVADVQGGRKTRSGSRSGEMLLNGLMSHWTTPMASDVKKQSENPETTKRRLLAGRQVGLNAHMGLTATSGTTPNGSSATTEKRGAPNPAFAMWLMGFPEALIVGILEAVALRRRKK